MSAPGWAAALLAVLACWLTMGDPALRLRGLTPAGGAPTEGTAALRRWFEGRPGTSPMPVRALLGLLVSGVLAGVLPGWAALPTLMIVTAGVVVGLGQLESGATRRRTERLLDEMPETLDLMAVALDAGAPLRGAVREVAVLAPTTTAELLGEVRSQVEIGVAEADAWASIAARGSVVGPWTEVAKDLARSAETGSAVAELLRMHADESRQRRVDERLAAARKVGVNSVLPLMACFLPAFMLTGVIPVIAGLIGDLAVR